ncbi:uncharacterized protein LOC111871038, partial [Cryptotermes secundus]|uniref:uncharacterized protein LOC111871038 n=1 Tax=Cryptotermes secundus TaxID=105785 RepID=UPI000CD7C94A
MLPRAQVTQVTTTSKNGRMPRILLQRAQETFPAVTERMNCTNSEKVLVGPYGETYPGSHANQVMNIKVEASDSQEEADPVQITVQEVKSEPENCTNSENALVGPYGMLVEQSSLPLQHTRLQLSFNGAIPHGLDVDSVNSSSNNFSYVCVTTSETMLRQK